MRAHILHSACRQSHTKSVTHLVLNEVKFNDKEDEVTETGIEVGFSTHLLQNLKVVQIHVRVYPKESLEHCANNVSNVGGKRLANTNGEDGLVIETRLHPCHHEVYVFRGTASDWLFDTHPICPLVLIVFASCH